MPTLTPETIAQLVELYEQTTQGIYGFTEHGFVVTGLDSAALDLPVDCGGIAVAEIDCYGGNLKDGHWYAAAHNAIPAIFETLTEKDAEVERLTNVLEGKLDSDTLLRYLNVHEGAISMGFSPPQFVMHILAQMFAVAIDGAPNYMTTELTMKAQQYEMTIRRVEGKTPGQALNELRAELQQEKADHQLTIDTFRQQERIWNQKFAEKLATEIDAMKIEIESRLSAELQQANERIAKLREALQELADSPAEFDDERIGYISVQMDRGALQTARELLEIK